MNLRKAKLTDVENILTIINSYAEQGLMLPRSRNMLYENIRDFLLVEEDARIIGVGALHVLWEDLAEVRSLAIAPEYKAQGIGKRLVESLVEEAMNLGCTKVFALTYQPGFFERCGFRLGSKEELPHKVWGECINCIKFPTCDEIAVILEL